MLSICIDCPSYYVFIIKQTLIRKSRYSIVATSSTAKKLEFSVVRSSEDRLNLAPLEKASVVLQRCPPEVPKRGRLYGACVQRVRSHHNRIVDDWLLHRVSEASSNCQTPEKQTVKPEPPQYRSCFAAGGGLGSRGAYSCYSCFPA